MKITIYIFDMICWRRITYTAVFQICKSDYPLEICKHLTSLHIVVGEKGVLVGGKENGKLHPVTEELLQFVVLQCETRKNSKQLQNIQIGNFKLLT